MIVSNNHSDLKEMISRHDWLKYSIELSISNVKPDDIPLYTKQYDLDIIIVDLKNEGDTRLQKEYRQICREENVTILFLNPYNIDKGKLKKMIENYNLFD